MPVSVLCETGMLDLYKYVPDETKRQRQAELDKAQRQWDDCRSILQSIGVSDNRGAPSCSDIVDSLAALCGWATSPLGARALSAPPKPPVTSAVLSPDNSDNTFGMLAQHGVWESIAKRIDDHVVLVQGQRRRAERTERFVLRAFVVADSVADTGGSDSTAHGATTVVRRFGKTQGPGHYSAVDKTGICRPVRAQDIKGTVVESMWVCCNDDAECKGSSGLGTDSAGIGVSRDGSDRSVGAEGLNTVVADPDDEIFCRLCDDPESWSYNQIIICDGCEQGVHQMCHVPIVKESELTLDQWYCSSCTRANKGNDNAKRQRTD
ncbi:mitochondrial transcription factor 2 [Coemansia sp. RSA 1939]|nr:mitochondrial transcription factor 2 [Coemansia sp. RSA 1939]